MTVDDEMSSDSEDENDVASLDNYSENDEELIEVRLKNLLKLSNERRDNKEMDENLSVKSCGDTNSVDHDHLPVGSEFENENADFLNGQATLNEKEDNVSNAPITSGVKTSNKGICRNISHSGNILPCTADSNFQGYSSDYQDSSDEERVIQDEVDSDMEEKILMKLYTILTLIRRQLKIRLSLLKA